MVYFNKAVILYHLSDYNEAIEILTPLLEKLDELDESILTKAGLLFISLLIETNQLKKAYTFLKKLENHTGFNTDDEYTTKTNTDEATNQKNNLDIENSIDNVKRNFKLISLLTNIISHKSVEIPDDDVSIELIFYYKS